MKSPTYLAIASAPLLTSTAAEAGSGASFGIAAIGALIPLGLMVTVILFLFFRSHNQKQIYLAAIEKGLPLPEKQEADSRKPAIVLITVGLGLAAVALVTGIPVEKWIWTVISVLVGIGLLIYHRLVTKERAGEASATDQQ